MGFLLPSSNFLWHVPELHCACCASAPYLAGRDALISYYVKKIIHIAKKRNKRVSNLTWLQSKTRKFLMSSVSVPDALCINQNYYKSMYVLIAIFLKFNGYLCLSKTERSKKPVVHFAPHSTSNFCRVPISQPPTNHPPTHKHKKNPILMIVQRSDSKSVKTNTSYCSEQSIG